MSKQIIILFLLLSGCCSLAQQVHTLYFSKSSIDTTQVVYDSTTYLNISYLDLRYSGKPGEPSLPVQYIKLLIPYDKDISTISVTDSSFEYMRLYHKVLPVQEYRDNYDDSIPSFTYPDSALYASSDYFPASPLELISTDYFDGFNHIATIAVYPVRYSPAKDSLKIISSLTISITSNNATYAYKLPLKRTAFHQSMQDSLLKYIVDNPEKIGDLRPSSSWVCQTLSDSNQLSPDYLIVTTISLKAALEPFVLWKKQKGLTVGVTIIDSIINNYSGDNISSHPINDPAGCVRQYLYDKWRYGTKFVLLIGSKDSIPYRIGTSVINDSYRGSNIPTDLYLAEYNGDWNMDEDSYYGEPYNTIRYQECDNPDFSEELYLGRILCDNTQEAISWIQKTTEYEQDPFNGDYSKVRKILWSQADQMQDPSPTNSIYTAQYISSDKVSQNFSFLDHEIIQELPSHNDSSPYRPTGIKIITELNDGYGFYNIYNHGWPDHYLVRSPGESGNSVTYRYVVTTLDALEDANDFQGETGNGFDNTGDNLSTLIYSISFRNCEYDDSTKCLGEIYTTLDHRGGPAFLGNTRMSFRCDAQNLHKLFIKSAFDASPNSRQYSAILGIAESISKFKGFPFIVNAHIGHINYVHNLFGEPSLQIWTDIPSEFANVSFTDNPTSVLINSNESQSTIVVRSLDSAFYQCFNETSSITVNTDKRPLEITITKANKIPYRVLLGGIANYSFTLEADHNIVSDLIVPSGKTIAVKGGASLKFLANSSLIIRGNYSFSGSASNRIILNFVQPSSQIKNGLKFINCPNGNISYLDFKNGFYGIYEDTTSVEINHCAFDSCTNAIVLHQVDTYVKNNSINAAVIGINLSFDDDDWYYIPELTSNTINASSEGIFLKNTYCWVDSNLIIGPTDYGIVVDGGGPELGWFQHPGYNSFRDCFFGLQAIGTNVYMGSFDSPPYLNGGFNSMNDIYWTLVDASGGSNVYAEQNWWGADSSQNFDYAFVLSDSSYIDYSNWLTSDPFSKSFVSLANGAEIVNKNTVKATMIDDDSTKTRINLQSSLKQLKQMVKHGNCWEAFGRLKTLINENVNEIGIGGAFHLLAEASSRLPVLQQEYIQFLQGFTSTNYNSVVRTISAFHLAATDNPSTPRLMDNIIQNDTNMGHIAHAFFEKFYYYHFINHNKDSALLNYNKMYICDSNSAFVKIAGSLLGLKVEGFKIKKRALKISENDYMPQQYKLCQNYPNPFNLITKILYELPQKGFVNLTVYDILGRQVAELVNTEQTAGRYEVEFGSNIIASGIYFYVLKTRDYLSIKKMTLIK